MFRLQQTGRTSPSFGPKGEKKRTGANLISPPERLVSCQVCLLRWPRLGSWLGCCTARRHKRAAWRLVSHDMLPSTQAGWLAGRVCGGSRIERCRQRQYFAAVKSGSCCSTFSFNFEVASPRCSPRRCRDVVVCARLFLERCEALSGAVRAFLRRVACVFFFLLFVD